MELPFVKMQGVGNDFVVLDGREQPLLDWERLAIRLCNRHKGIGADGLLVLENSEVADFRMRMHNPDGSPDVCGNGLRCLARYAFEVGAVHQSGMQIETLAGVRGAKLCLNERGEVAEVSVNMGVPVVVPHGIPFLSDAPSPILNFPLPLANGESIRITPLSTGSTHAVTFVEALPTDPDFLRISPQVENHSLFPERTSLMWCVVDSPHRLRIRIWERGAGETWGCGTGACATAVAAILHGISPQGEPITVASRGGELTIRWREGATIEKTGPAVTVFQGVLHSPS